MLVSAISSNSCLNVSNIDHKAKYQDCYADTAFNSLNTRKSNNDKQTKLFDSINEWKNFCHKQIEQGKFDIIA